MHTVPRPDARPPAPILVGLTGRLGVGKHEVAHILAQSHGFRGIAITDPIRDMLYELDPILGNGLTLRMLVDDLGWTAAARHRLYGPEVCRLLQSFECGVGQDMISATLWTDLARAPAASSSTRASLLSSPTFVCPSRRR